MKNINWALCALLGLVALSCSGNRLSRIQEVNIVPKPTSLNLSSGAFELNAQTQINLIHIADTTLFPAIDFLNALVVPCLGRSLEIKYVLTPGPEAINITIDTTLHAEAYQLNIGPGQIDITGGSAAGVFSAFESIRQLLPEGALMHQKASIIELPRLRLANQPVVELRDTLLQTPRRSDVEL